MTILNPLSQSGMLALVPAHRREGLSVSRVKRIRKGDGIISFLRYRAPMTLKFALSVVS
ncbi:MULTISPECIES: hypothetical protein [unclassified Asaia]|uniref:hypothetical protein n=1 Tax=unclassified Asaia TaxID=2685023 RepID=UPI001315AD6C|nr:hypothetical protein [Asaia sp. W19]